MSYPAPGTDWFLPETPIGKAHIVAEILVDTSNPDSLENRRNPHLRFECGRYSRFHHLYEPRPDDELCQACRRVVTS